MNTDLSQFLWIVTTDIQPILNVFLNIRRYRKIMIHTAAYSFKKLLINKISIIRFLLVHAKVLLANACTHSQDEFIVMSF